MCAILRGVTLDIEPGLDRYRRLGMIVRALVSDVGMEEIANIIVQQGLAGLNASGAGFAFLVDGKMWRVAAVGSTAGSVAKTTLAGRGQPLGEPNPCCVAIRTGEEVWITDREAGLREFPGLAQASALSQGWVALPLKHQGQTFGAFSLSFVVPPVFDAVDQQFIRALGDVAALALAPMFEAATRADGAGQQSVGDPLARALFDRATGGLVVVDGQGTIVECTDRLCRMLGYEPGDLIGHSVEVLLPHDRREQHARDRKRYVDDPVPRSEGAGLDLVALRADGTELPVELTLSPCSTASGLRIFAVVRPLA